jgi:hypothetical protein
MLATLDAAVTGRRGREQLSEAARITLFGAARIGLDPLIKLCASDTGISEWIAEYLEPLLTSEAKDLAYGAAYQRVNDSILVGENKVIDVASDQEPREQGSLLREEVGKLVPTMKQLNEYAVRRGEHQFEHDAEHLSEGHSAQGGGKILALANTLSLIDGYLSMTDDELREHSQEIHSVLGAVTTYSELVKAVIEFVGGALGVSVGAMGSLAAAVGDVALANTCRGFAETTALNLSTVVSWIEVLHGGMELVNPHSTRQERIDGAVDVAAGATWLIGKQVLGGSVAAGAAASSMALSIGYAELKWELTTYWEAALGLNRGLAGPAFETLREDGDSLARSLETLQKASLLAQQEDDPAKREPLERVVANLAHDVRDGVERIVSDTRPSGPEAGLAHHPGAVGPIIQDLFAPLGSFRNAETPDMALQGGRIALQKVAWALKNWSTIVFEETRHGDIIDAQKDVEKAENVDAGKPKE